MMYIVIVKYAAIRFKCNFIYNKKQIKYWMLFCSISVNKLDPEIVYKLFLQSIRLNAPSTLFWCNLWTNFCRIISNFYRSIFKIELIYANILICLGRHLYAIWQHYLPCYKLIYSRRQHFWVSTLQSKYLCNSAACMEAAKIYNFLAAVIAKSATEESLESKENRNFWTWDFFEAE